MRYGPSRPRFRGALARRLLGVALLLGLAVPLGAQAPAAELQEPAGQAAEPGSELTVYLMTIGQGDAVWERFGHNAIWIHDAVRGTDVAYNYGMFSFDEPGYLGRFLRGHMTYWMQPVDGPASMRHYAQVNRSVWLQELNLTPAQRVRLRDFVEWNARAENKFYQYDYFHDNCSTRVRDALDYALGGALREVTEGQATGTTYRSHSLRLTAPQIATWTGLLLGLGSIADRPIDAWEESFIPMRLMAHVRAVQVEGPDGAREPLVRSERVLFQATRPPAPDQPPQRTLAYLIGGLLIGAALVLLGHAAGPLANPHAPAGARSAAQRAAAVGFIVLAVAWSVVAGFFGAVLAALWAFTDHVAAYYNENLLQLSPLSLVLAVVLPFARRPAALRIAATVAVGVAALSALGLLIQVLPGFAQVNGGIIALALPPNLALAWTLVRSARASREIAPPGARSKHTPAARTAASRSPHPVGETSAARPGGA